MKVFRIVAAIALLAGPAYAQTPQLIHSFDSKTPQQKADDERYLEAEQRRRTEREGPDEQRAYEQNFALREIDDLRGPIDDDERDRDQAIDQADQSTVDQCLSKADHALSRRLIATCVRIVLTEPS